MTIDLKLTKGKWFLKYKREKLRYNRERLQDLYIGLSEDQHAPNDCPIVGGCGCCGSPTFKNEDDVIGFAALHEFKAVADAADEYIDSIRYGKKDIGLRIAIKALKARIKELKTKQEE